jgi:hypothetical protein
MLSIPSWMWGKNTPKKSPAGEVRRGRVAAQNQPVGNLQKRCCTNIRDARFWIFNIKRDIAPAPMRDRESAFGHNDDWLAKTSR